MEKDAGLRAGLKNLSRRSEDVAKYYDDWAEDYDRTLAEWRYQAPERVAAMLREALAPSARILDAGCGTGLSGRALAAAGFTAVDGIDVSQRSLDVAAGRGVYRRLERVDMQRLPLPLADGRYDGLACVGVLTYLPDSRGILQEFSRILRSGGLMVLTQRTDLFARRDFGGALDALVRKGLAEDVRVSRAAPYLPENEEFADEIGIHYITCRVV